LQTLESIITKKVPEGYTIDDLPGLINKEWILDPNNLEEIKEIVERSRNNVMEGQTVSTEQITPNTSNQYVSYNVREADRSVQSEPTQIEETVENAPEMQEFGGFTGMDWSSEDDSNIFEFTEEQMQENVEQRIDGMFAEISDPALEDQKEFAEQVVDRDDTTITQQLEIADMQAQEVPKQADELDEEEQPQPLAPEEMDVEDQMAEEYKKETTFEDNGPGGILGFLSAMASKFIPKKLQERFMQKDKTKQLSAGEPEVTRKDGIVQKSYYGNGTLKPSLLKGFQTKTIEIAGSVMSAISKMARISKSDDNEIKNPPTVFKSVEQSEKQPSQELSEQQNVNVFDRQNQVFARQEGAKRDDNPWAVEVNTNMEKVAVEKSNKVETVARANHDTVEVTQEELSEQDDGTR